MKTLFLCTSFLLALFISTQADILHYSETTAYDHRTREVSLSFFQALGKTMGHEVIEDKNGSEFDTAENLRKYDLVIFSNTSGANGLSETQRENFENYIENGGSFLGIHAASDTYRHSSANGSLTGVWDWYSETLTGCSVQNGPNHTSNNHVAAMEVHKPKTSLAEGLPSPWIKTEEYYYWENGYLSSDFSVLLSVERTGNYSYDEERMVAQFRELPWGGKAFYTSMGHAPSNFTTDLTFQKLMKNVVHWLGKKK